MDDLSHIRGGMDWQKQAAEEVIRKLADTGTAYITGHYPVTLGAVPPSRAEVAVDRAFESNHSAAPHSWG